MLSGIWIPLKKVALIFLLAWISGASAQTVYYSKSSGNLNSLSTWGLNSDGSGSSPLSFTLANVIYIITNTSTASIGGTWLVSGTGSKVQVGDGISGTEFIVPGTAAFFGTADVANAATLTILNSTNPTLGNLASGSMVNYAGSGGQNVVCAYYSSLMLSGSGQKSFFNTFGSSVSNSLIIMSPASLRLHILPALTFSLFGTISGNGGIVGSSSTVLDILGSGDLGTLTFTSSSSLYQLRLNRSNSGYVRLGTNITVGNAFVHNQGILALNDKHLILNGAVSFPATLTDGAIEGSLSSSLSIGSSSTPIVNALLMDQTSAATKNLDRLVLNRAAQTLTLGSDLSIDANFTQTNGTIDLNGHLLQLEGNITWPATYTNGVVSGSPTSSLSIGGAGTISNAMFVNQNSSQTKTFQFLSMNRSGQSLTLGSDLICSGDFNHQAGSISVGTTSLTLSGNISFPASASNGSLTGSATSSLCIDGSGALTNALVMNQSSTGARTLSNLTLNRSAATLVLANPLIATNYAQNDGHLNLNGTSLNLNGSVTFPVSSLNGVLIGSPSSSLLINTSTATVTNPLWMDASSNASKTLSQFLFSRLTQTLVVGTDLIVSGNYSQSNGSLDLNGRLLQLDGIITWPTSYSIGVVSGSPASSLSIGGSGAINNSIKIDQSSTASKTFYSVSINRPGVTLTLGNDLMCTGDFNHTNGNLSLGTTQLSLQGNISFPASASSGSLIGSTTSSLLIDGSGSLVNAIVFAQASTANRSLANFQLNRSGSTLSLGNALVVTNFTHSNGLLNLNGSSLNLNGSIVFPASPANGLFIGSATSSLLINTSTAVVTNSLSFDPSSSGSKTLAQFLFSRASQTLNLGSDLIVDGIFSHSNGRIDLNGRSFTINGVITFPSTVTNGAFMGSTTTTLNIGGNGAITNSLKLDASNAAYRTFDMFTLNHTGGTLTLGSSLLCVSSFNHSNGPFSIGANQLSLTGAISFPLSASNGSFTGSTTSSLSISGSGSIQNTLFMSQASAAARTFGELVLNRSNEILRLGNPLVCNVFNQSNGSLDINGSSLSLNGAITFPASSANGELIGSLSSSLSIGGSGTITNTLNLNQSSSANRSLYDLTMARTGQALILGSNLEIRNAITPTTGSIVSGNFLRLKADGVRSGMVGTVGGSMSGTITVECFLPGGATGWTNMGPAGMTGLTVSSWESQMFMTCYGCPYDENSAGGFFVSIQSYSESLGGSSAYVPLSYTSALTNGRGYWVYSGNGMFTTTDQTIATSGPIKTGNSVLAVTNSSNSGYNLMSNPFPAPIDWDLVAADPSNANISGSVYFYNPDISQTISYAAGVSNPSGYITNGIIPMGQGFYIQANTNTNLVIRESHKSTQNTSANPLLKQPAQKVVDPVFRLSVTGHQGDYDETTFRFHAAATDSFDRLLDAYKVFETPGYLGYPGVYSKYTSISSRIKNTDYSINSLPVNPGKDLNIPILVRAQHTGSYVIAPIDIQNFPADLCVYLFDHLLNQVHDLRNGAYSCEIADTTSMSRFELNLCTGRLSLGTSEQEQSTNEVKFLQAPGGILTVKTNFTEEERAWLSVFNTQGQKLIHDVVLTGSENLVQLHLEHLQDQLVLVQLTHKNGVIQRKFYLY